MGVDFKGYLQRLQGDVERNWDPLIPAEAQKPQLLAAVVGLRLTILRDGTIGSMKLEYPSGSVAFDRAAWGAVTSEGKFPPLPATFHGHLIDLRLVFLYNTPPPPAR